MRGGGAVLRLLGVVGWEVSINKPANTQKTGKRGGKTKTSWRPGQSGNPKGAPKRGESWAELITKYGNMTGDEVATIAGYMAKEFKRLPEGVTLKELVVMRVYGQMINEPSPGLLSAFMDRTDGKVKESIDLTVIEKVFKVDIDDDGQDQNTDQAENLQ